MVNSGVRRLICVLRTEMSAHMVLSNSVARGRMPAAPVKRAHWLQLTIAAICFWGLYGVAFKLAADRLPALAGQVLSSLGLLLPALFLIKAVLRERRSTAGLLIGVTSGLCGAIGNFALLASLGKGGKASVVFPLTALYPLVTVIIATLFLKERVRRAQGAGIALAIVAVVLLSWEGNVSPLAVTAGFGLTIAIPLWFLGAASALPPASTA